MSNGAIADLEQAIAIIRAHLGDTKPQKRVVQFWVNIYPTSDPVVHTSRERADAGPRDDRIACLHIIREYEREEGL